MREKDSVKEAERELIDGYGVLIIELVESEILCYRELTEADNRGKEFTLAYELALIDIKNTLKYADKSDIPFLELVKQRITDKWNLRKTNIKL